MEVLSGTNARPADPRPAVATIGMFDGVHRGHAALFEQVVADARAIDAAAAIVTFDPHPMEVLAPDRAPCALTTIDQRLELFESHGFDLTLVLPFDKKLSKSTPAEFVKTTLADELHVRKVYVGEDFRFGHNRAGDVNTLTELGAELGFESVAIGLVGNGTQKISSTDIRRLVAEGAVGDAAALLGRPYRLAGEVVRGQAIARELHGFPTVNLATRPRACIPGLGVYAGWWVWKDVRLPGVINVGRERGPGHEPAPDPVVEIHIFDFDEDVAGEQGEIEFTAFIRPEMRFDGVEALIDQIRADADRAREVLAT